MKILEEGNAKDLLWLKPKGRRQTPLPLGESYRFAKVEREGGLWSVGFQPPTAKDLEGGGPPFGRQNPSRKGNRVP